MLIICSSCIWTCYVVFELKITQCCRMPWKRVWRITWLSVYFTSQAQSRGWPAVGCGWADVEESDVIVSNAGLLMSYTRLLVTLGTFLTPLLYQSVKWE